MGELLGIARFRFHEGKVDEYKRLSKRAMEIVKAKDTGTLQYDVYFNDDESEAIVIERYRDSQALIEHGEHMAEVSDAVLATASVEGEVLGSASPELEEKLADSPVRLFKPFLSM
ncbi:MAG TPA: antibiotic biosynthesis monooxygenase [Candidatus Limnocylindria bacterium]